MCTVNFFHGHSLGSSFKSSNNERWNEIERRKILFTSIILPVIPAIPSQDPFTTMEPHQRAHSQLFELERDGFCFIDQPKQTGSSETSFMQTITAASFYSLSCTFRTHLILVPCSPFVLQPKENVSIVNNVNHNSPPLVYNHKDAESLVDVSAR